MKTRNEGERANNSHNDDEVHNDNNVLDNLNTIPDRATIRSEYIHCGRKDCDKRHGPYYYAYWKQEGKLRKAYVGSSLELGKEAYRVKKTHGIARSVQRKVGTIRELAEMGYPSAIAYSIKLRSRRCSINWAYRVVIDCFMRNIYEPMLQMGLDPKDSHQLQSFIENMSKHYFHNPSGTESSHSSCYSLEFLFKIVCTALAYVNGDN
ncbi:MAG: hypothetical protein ABI347_11020 [Nitrososphaera sp.]|jgi:hypothetical protein